jgi:hypothetical protein
MELVQKIDGNRAPLHMFEVAQLANLIPQVSVSVSLDLSSQSLSLPLSLDLTLTVSLLLALDLSDSPLLKEL